MLLSMERATTEVGGGLLQEKQLRELLLELLQNKY
jgi:hypothetical protein